MEGGFPRKGDFLQPPPRVASEAAAAEVGTGPRWLLRYRYLSEIPLPDGNIGQPCRACRLWGPGTGSKVEAGGSEVRRKTEPAGTFLMPVCPMKL